jgi:ribosomal-protein-alanine N-acetyltransferase
MKSAEYVFMSVLEENFKVVGYVVWSEYRALKIGRVWNLAIEETHRKRGHGRRLLNHVFDNMREKGLLVCRLEVRESNTAAHCLYESEGMSAIDRVDKYYRTEDAIIYSIEL